MRIAVTGATGFTGRYVGDALVRAGLDWTPLTLDLADFQSIERAVIETRFDRLIHLAAVAFVASDDWASFYRVNQIGTFALLDAVARHRPGARCLLASSAQVYGAAVQGLIGEDERTCPANHYAASKLAMEIGARRWEDRLDIVVTRPFNYTGVGQEDRYLIPKIVSHFVRRADRIELGNLHVRRDFGDVRSVADAYLGLVTSDHGMAEPVNIATGHTRTIADILTLLTDLTGHRLRVEVNPAFVRANDVPMLGGKIDRLQALLPDWRPKPLEETLFWMVAA